MERSFGKMSENIITDVAQNRQWDAGGEKPDVWVNTVCGFCGSGCGIEVGLRQGQVVTLRGREDYPVNMGHLCIKGFYQWKALNSVERARNPMLRKDGRLVVVSWEEALAAIEKEIGETLLKAGPSSLGIYNTGQLTLEEYYVLGKLARGFIGTANIDASLRLCMSSASHALIRAFGADTAPGCYEDLDLADCILIFGSNPAEMFPQLWRRIRARQKKGAYLVVVDPRKTATARAANLHLPIKPGQNIPLLNSFLQVLFQKGLVDGNFVAEYTTGWEKLRDAVEEYTPEKVEDRVGIAANKIREAAVTFGEAPRATSIFMQGVFQSVGGADAANLIINLHLITGKIGRPGSSPLVLTGQANSMGCREAGGAASFVGMRNSLNPLHRGEVALAWGINEAILPQYTNNIFHMLEKIERGELQLLWNIASNPAVSLPNLAKVHQQLDKVFLIVQDIYYPMETAQFADVFLPAAGWGEKLGTFTNSERRVSLVEGFQAAPGEAKTDLEIFQLLAKRLGFGKSFGWSDSEKVFDEWKRLSANRPCDMGGISYNKLRSKGSIQWPCPDHNHGGTRRLFSDKKFFTGPNYSQLNEEDHNKLNKARIQPAKDILPLETPNEQYPFWLNTGRLLEHYHTRTKTKRVPELNRLISSAFFEINPLDAVRLAIRKGQWMKVVSPRGSIVLPAKVTDTAFPGQIFIPFHFGDLDPGEDRFNQAANRLTHEERDEHSSQPILKLSVCRLEEIDDPTFCN